MMTADHLSKLKRSLILHEGYKNFPYLDTVGKISIGIGYNLSDRGIDDEWIQDQYSKDVKFFYDKLSEFHWFSNICIDRQIVLVDMAFMGWKKFLEFESLISALEIGNYSKAAQEILNSKWAEQVKGRALTLARAMESGVYNV